ncbi:MAG: TolB family protein [Chloroflexota bacterium]
MKFYNVFTAVLFASIALFSSSCRSNKCPEELSWNNLGELYNTRADEYGPVASRGRLYFTMASEGKRAKETIYSAPIINGKPGAPRREEFPPMAGIPGAASPSFFVASDGSLELYFSGDAKAKDPKYRNPKNKDIYYSINKKGVWSEPVALSPAVNSVGFDSHPAVAPDGSFILFSSERDGGEGGLDLYISRRNADGSWGEAKNVGKPINTPENDVFPAIASDGSLIYSSRGFSEKKDYQIAIAAPANNGGWATPKVPGYPVNTPYNETGAWIEGSSIYVSSERAGGCGKKDLYMFDYCAPVRYEGRAIAEDAGMPVAGELKLLDAERKELSSIKVGDDGAFGFKLEPSKTYYIRFFPICDPTFTPEQKIVAPCIDTAAVVFTQNILLRSSLSDYDFAAIDAPFFVTGYYYPNTRENLEDLRLKFAYNLFGKSDTTKYIENPGEEYDAYAESVEKALDRAADYITEILQNLSGECASKTNAKLVIKLTGFADPRPISLGSKYVDGDIADPEFGVNVAKGAAMNNDVLSLLRAYYTGKQLKIRIEKHSELKSVFERVKWIAVGGGIEPDEAKSYEKRRKVNIEIGIEK